MQVMSAGLASGTAENYEKTKCVKIHRRHWSLAKLTSPHRGGGWGEGVFARQARSDRWHMHNVRTFPLNTSTDSVQT
jgi:hypothetical protein